MGEKKVTGRKRHILVDTTGNLLAVCCTAANIADLAGARALLESLGGRFPRLKKIWADQGYSGAAFAESVNAKYGISFEVVQRPAGSHTFTVLPRRWVVERSLAWLGRDRRLSKDYERSPATTEGIIWLSEASRLLKHVTKAH